MLSLVHNKSIRIYFQGGSMMKKVALIFCFAVSVWAQNDPVLKASAMNTGYIPSGFDSNDHVQMVVEGVYRDTCSRSAGTRVNVNQGAKTISVTAYEYRYSGPCLDVTVPHDEVVNFGIVPPGNYQVVQGNGRPLGRLNVNVARTNTPDDYLYAPVSQAYVKNVGGKLALTLSGVFTNSCMSVKRVVSNVNENVLTIQPIAELLPTYANCIHGSFPFEYSTYIPMARAGRYLLHVRSLNGKSINTLFDWQFASR